MSASARQRKHEEERPCWLAFHFHSVLLIFVNLWQISTLCVADIVHAVADMVCGRYRRFPNPERNLFNRVSRKDDSAAQSVLKFSQLYHRVLKSSLHIYHS